MDRHTRRRVHRWWPVGLIAAVILLGATALVIRGLSTSDTSPGLPAPGTTTSRTATPSTTMVPPATGQAALVVKIDNVQAARPASGLGGADVVYVEPVEGGLTRLVAVYLGTPPEVVGPVRSARRTDIELLGQYGTPVLAYSGAVPELLPALRAANLANASPEETPGAYYRDSSRPAPHNLYLHPQRISATARPGPVAALAFGPAPPVGAACVRYDAGFRAAAFGLTWSPSAGRWLISMDGSPMTSTESGRLGAATVVVQRVVVSTDDYAENATGGAAPVAHTIGQGTATILRDGQRFDAAWTRPDATAPTRFHTASGAELRLSPGPVWILLIPV